jgi:hypothetical protein
MQYQVGHIIIVGVLYRRGGGGGETPGDVCVYGMVPRVICISYYLDLSNSNTSFKY